MWLCVLINLFLFCKYVCPFAPLPSFLFFALIEFMLDVVFILMNDKGTVLYVIAILPLFRIVFSSFISLIIIIFSLSFFSFVLFILPNISCFFVLMWLLYVTCVVKLGGQMWFIFLGGGLF
eukprot:TRINITY_DN11670_c0_g1_i1.p1 TRINITY_DN11670_c0_g1~~TRINITY_DN11670_c0_g1_i1.p1  ORF type:complete len:121 (+),score=4.02 TRINITY_DN11670_c0_g1_i1:138-500(+)